MDYSVFFCASFALFTLSSAVSWAFSCACSIFSPFLSTLSCCRSEDGAEDGFSAGAVEALEVDGSLDAEAELDAEAVEEDEALDPGSPGPELIPRSTVVPRLTAVPG
jgi:hypothetical protein